MENQDPHQAFMEAWISRLEKESRDLDLAIEDDRVTFRARVFSATANLRMIAMKELVGGLLGLHEQGFDAHLPRSRHDATRYLAATWIARVARSPKV
jgi:hypothetical protein